MFSFGITSGVVTHKATTEDFFFPDLYDCSLVRDAFVGSLSQGNVVGYGRGGKSDFSVSIMIGRLRWMATSFFNLLYSNISSLRG